MPAKPQPERRVCPACGRPLAQRGKRAEADRVYCSRRCRSRRVGPRERAREQAIVALLDARDAGASICPSEAARVVGEDAWRDEMEEVRRAGRRLAARGVVEFTQGGRVVDPSTVRGPVRLRRGPGFDAR